MTDRIPKFLTEGIEEIELRVVSWNAKLPSLGVYRAYTHTDPMAELPIDERGSTYDIGTPAGPSDDGVEPVCQEIADVVAHVQEEHTPGWGRELVGMGMAYAHADWIEAADRQKIAKGIKNSVDFWAVRQAMVDGAVEKAGWGTHGLLGQAVVYATDTFEEQG